jgi:hypothetical protein
VLHNAIVVTALVCGVPVANPVDVLVNTLFGTTIDVESNNAVSVLADGFIT